MYQDITVNSRAGVQRFWYRAEVIENSVDPVNNTSNVTITFYVWGKYNPQYDGYDEDVGIIVDGETKVSQVNHNKRLGTEMREMCHWTGDITHDADGTKEITVSVWLDCGGTASYLPKPSTEDEPLEILTCQLTPITRGIIRIQRDGVKTGIVYIQRNGEPKVGQVFINRGGVKPGV